MTDPWVDEEMVEVAARSIHDAAHKGLRNCYAWDSVSIDIEHPGYRARIRDEARAALLAIAPLFREKAARVAIAEKEKWVSRVREFENHHAEIAIERYAVSTAQAIAAAIRNGE